MNFRAIPLALILSLIFHTSIVSALNEKRGFQKPSDAFLQSACPLIASRGIEGETVRHLLEAEAMNQHRQMKAKAISTGIMVDASMFAGAVLFHLYYWGRRVQVAQGGGQMVAYEAPAGMRAFMLQRGLTTQALMASFVAVGSSLFANAYFITSLLSGRVSNRFGELQEFFTSFFKPRRDDKDAKNFVRLATRFLQYSCMRADIPAKIDRDYFEPLFARVFSDMFTSEGQFLGDEGVVERLDRGLQTVLMIPFQKKKLDLSNFSKELGSVLAQYPREIKLELARQTVAFSAGANQAQEAQLSRKPVIYFLGEPGTGKTHLAEKYAEVVGLPLVKLSFRKEDLTDELMYGGRGSYSAGSAIENLKQFDKPSLITEAIVLALKKKPKLKGSNFIFFLDEVDKVLNGGSVFDGSSGANAFLLKLLDPSKTHVELKDLGLSIDVSSCLFILAGNKPILNEALRNRMKTIVFPAMEPAKKLAIAQAEWPKILKKYDLENAPEYDELVTKLVTLDNNPGVRAILLTLDDYAKHLDLDRKAEFFTWLEGGIGEFNYKAVLATYSSGEVSTKERAQHMDGEEKFHTEVMAEAIVRRLKSSTKQDDTFNEEPMKSMKEQFEKSEDQKKIFDLMAHVIAGYIRANLADAAQEKVADEVEAKVADEVEAKVADEVEAKVADEVEAKVADEVEAKVAD
ncbi:MAG: AAA family ATPase, partial [Oligoflexales bacterium]|nr:AAA family ATPase [Oligoflexales bacterium]